MAPENAICQIRSMLPRINKEMVPTPIEGGTTCFARWTKKQEGNFPYVLPEDPDKPMEIVVPSALQMGWAELQRCICGVSETARDVTVTYIAKPTGSLTGNPLKD
jgi:hypothetical protein